MSFIMADVMEQYDNYLNHLYQKEMKRKEATKPKTVENISIPITEDEFVSEYSAYLGSDYSEYGYSDYYPVIDFEVKTYNSGSGIIEYSLYLL